MTGWRMLLPGLLGTFSPSSIPDKRDVNLVATPLGIGDLQASEHVDGVVDGDTQADKLIRLQFHSPSCFYPSGRWSRGCRLSRLNMPMSRSFFSCVTGTGWTPPSVLTNMYGRPFILLMLALMSRTTSWSLLIGVGCPSEVPPSSTGDSAPLFDLTSSGELAKDDVQALDLRPRGACHALTSESLLALTTSRCTAAIVCACCASWGVARP